MISNEPLSCRLSVQSGWRVSVAASMLAALGKLPDLAKTFALQATKAATYLRDHALDHPTAEGAARPRLVALDANVDAGIEDDRNRQGMPLSRQLDPGLAIGGADVGGVDHSEFSSLQSLAADFADQIEGIGGSTLVGFIVRDQSAAIIGRKCFTAKVDLPEPVETMSTTSEKSGISNVQGVRARRVEAAAPRALLAHRGC
jgi:hypothetical protein